MRKINLLGAIAVIAITGTIVGACDDGGNNQQSGNTSTQSATLANTSTASSKEVFVWPGKNDKVAISGNLVTSNYMIVYDGSGSMGDPDPKCGIERPNTKHAEGLKAVKEFVKAIPDEANVGLYVFDSRGRKIQVALGENNKGKVLTGLDSVRPGDGTPLGEAVKVGYTALTAQAQKQLGYGRYSLVVVTDGAAGDANYLARVVDYVVEKSPVEIHAIGFCLGEGHTLNQVGRTFYASAKNPADLLKGLKGVLAETDLSDTEFSQ